MQLNVNEIKKQLSGKPKKIGELEGKPVFNVLTKGGLTMVAHLADNGDINVLGVGSHQLIARAVATNEHPKINFTELSKSESNLAPDVLKKYMPEFLELTHKFQTVVAAEQKVK